MLTFVANHELHTFAQHYARRNITHTSTTPTRCKCHSEELRKQSAGWEPLTLTGSQSGANLRRWMLTIKPQACHAVGAWP